METFGGIGVHKLERSPTLNTVIMIEGILRSLDGTSITIPDLKRKLPRQVNHNTLKIIIEYLEASGKIAFTSRGVRWVHDLRELRAGMEDSKVNG